MTADALVFEQILRRVLREELGRVLPQCHPAPDRGATAFLASLEAYFGEGRFTVAGLLTIAADEPHGDLGVALADVVDLNAGARAQATALGLLLSRMPEVEVVGECRGSAVYRLRT